MEIEERTNMQGNEEEKSGMNIEEKGDKIEVEKEEKDEKRDTEIANSNPDDSFDRYEYLSDGTRKRKITFDIYTGTFVKKPRLDKPNEAPALSKEPNSEVQPEPMAVDGTVYFFVLSSVIIIMSLISLFKFILFQAYCSVRKEILGSHQCSFLCLLGEVTPNPSAMRQSAVEGRCPICLGTFQRPYQSKCGHVCCYTCWKGWLERKLECPLCKEKTRMKTLQPAFLT